jgi:hypothetical protein
MARLANELNAKRIVQFYENVGGIENPLSCRMTTKHFEEEGIARTVVWRITIRFNERGYIDYHKITGKPPKRSVKSVKNLMERKPETSVTSGAIVTGMPRSTFQHIKRKKLNIRAYVKETVPKYSVDQIQRARKACRKFYNRILKDNLIIVMDDETYVHQDCEQIPGKSYFHAINKTSVSDEHRFKSEQKFPKRLLVWQAIDQFGNTSEPYISERTMNGKIYLEECLKKRLIPFLEEYHKKRKILFWPDLATCHYRQDVIQWMNCQNFEFVKRDENAPNVPQVRPIERY